MLSLKFSLKMQPHAYTLMRSFMISFWGLVIDNMYIGT